MIYIEGWGAIVSRIHGLTEAGRLWMNSLAIQKTEAFGGSARLLDQYRSICSALGKFNSQFSEILPLHARTCLVEFLSDAALAFDGQVSMTAALRQEMALSALVTLASFESEMSFLLSEAEQAIRARSERAFAHLQQLIVVDEEFRRKWQFAFAQNEIACERLGAVHLLWHGIWAFKVDSKGARTDLIFPDESVGQAANARRYSDGLVLTEWKKLSDNQKPEDRFAEARRQTQRYSQGALGGNELTSYRYAILVSSDDVRPPDDVAEGNVVYRHINIAVEPRSPSKAATRR